MHRYLVAAILLGGAGIASAKTSLTIGTPTVTGSLTVKAVGAVVAKTKAKLLACYERTPVKNAGKTSVTATFTIGADGKVSASEAAGIDADADACIAAAIQKLQFAKPADGKPVEVMYPLTFEAGAFDSLTGRNKLTEFGGTGNSELTGGFGGRGYGPGGGTGWGTIGTGRYGVIGEGGGTGSGYGVGGGRGGMRGRSTALPRVSIGQPGVAGDLDPAIIRRYIKRNIQKIQYCYEKQLVDKPKLAGTVMADFTIGADGLVSSSAASGMKDEPTESCIAGVIKAIEFPKPKSGGVVTVKYPLGFKPAP